MDFTSTIAAIASPPGISATGVIRVSGDRSIELVGSIFRGKPLLDQESHRLIYGKIVDGQGQIIDEVVVGMFRSPRSFTGENVVEISCHGSPFILQRVMERLIEVGVKQAEAGAFTKRAFLHGKMDLTMAEAVGDLIHSESTASHRSAINQLKGGIAEKISLLREELLRMTALLELELDFGEEDVEFADRTQLTSILNHIEAEVSHLIGSFATGRMVKTGISVAIIGKPNAGKSTLLNALLNEEKAIVSSIAGTTRDVIEDVKEIKGWTFRFYDTAGLRHTADEIESQGIHRAKKIMEKAHVLLYIFDSATSSIPEVKEEIKQLPQDKPIIILGNKSDKLDTSRHAEYTNECLLISAKNKLHLNLLEGQLCEKAGIDASIQDFSQVTNMRHFEALKGIESSIRQIHNGMKNAVSSEFIIQDIKHALEYMGSITGEVTNDEVLGAIFSKFCIGK